MKKVFFTLVFVLGVIGFTYAQDNTATLRREATQLPQKIIDPRRIYGIQCRTGFIECSPEAPDNKYG